MKHRSFSKFSTVLLQAVRQLHKNVHGQSSNDGKSSGFQVKKKIGWQNGSLWIEVKQCRKVYLSLLLSKKEFFSLGANVACSTYKYILFSNSVCGTRGK